MQKVVESIETDLELIGLTGVEDKLQEDVKPTLEMLRNAGIRVWMLTGDKVETATYVNSKNKIYPDLLSPDVSLFLRAWYHVMTQFFNLLSKRQMKLMRD